MEIGSTLAHYEVTERLGRGGMGEVFRATDKKLGREVALKVLPAELAESPAHLARFRREAMTLAALSHRGIVTVFSVEESDGVHFFTMEVVEGRPLSELIPPRGFAWERLESLAASLLDALAASHRRGVVHRDLKPANVMVSDAGAVKVLDFGLAKLRPVEAGVACDRTATAPLTVQGQILGTVAYMSPEQAEGRDVDERSDVFSLGVMLYELASGKRPFGGRSAVAVLAAILGEEPRPLSQVRADVPAWFAELVHACLSKEPERRPRDAGQLLHRWSAPQATRGWSSPIVSGGGATQPDGSIAVLPLRDLSAEPDQSLFADAMTEALIISLAKARGLRVIARSSSMLFKESQEPLAVVAARLGVANVVEGTVMRAGDRIRVTAQLVRVDTGEALWADGYQRDLSDVLELQDEIARAIAKEVRARLSEQHGDQQSSLARRGKVDPRAYEAYLRGRHLWAQRSEQKVLRAIHFFREAIDLDSLYALAHVGVADCYLVLGSQEIRPPSECFPYGKAAAIKALEIEDLAEAHASLAAMLHDWDWDWEAAAREYERALELNPGYATAHHWYAEFLTAAGNLDLARRHFEQARALDPLSNGMHADLAAHLLAAGELDGATAACRRVLEMDPGFLPARLTLGWARCLCGDHRSAILEFQEVLERDPGAGPRALAGLGHAHGAAGDLEQARAAIERLDRLSGERFVSHFNRAIVHAALGPVDELFVHLDRAVAGRERDLAYLLSTPAFHRVRDDERFRRLIARVGPPGRLG